MNDFDKCWCSRMLDNLQKMPITEPLKKIKADKDNDGFDFDFFSERISKNKYQSVTQFSDELMLALKRIKDTLSQDDYLILILEEIENIICKKLKNKPKNAQEKYKKKLCKLTKLISTHIEESNEKIN